MCLFQFPFIAIRAAAIDTYLVTGAATLRKFAKKFFNLCNKCLVIKRTGGRDDQIAGPVICPDKIHQLIA